MKQDKDRLEIPRDVPQRNSFPSLFNKRNEDFISIEKLNAHLQILLEENLFVNKPKENLSLDMSDKKITIDNINPKQAIGLSKLPLHLWSPLASAYGCLGLMNGKKYGYGNFKATPVIASIYISATKRHLSAWEEGQELDSDGVPHLSAILANIAILLESRSVGTLIDDRNIQGGYLKEIDELTKIANRINEIHKDTYHHYTIKDNPSTAIK